MAYFGDLVVFKSYNWFLVFSLSLLISISLFHDLLINLFLRPRPSFSAFVGLSFAQRFFCASSFAFSSS